MPSISTTAASALALLLAASFVNPPAAQADSTGAAMNADREYQVQGLEKPARIQVDRWGIPHIYANTHYDAFFVQGFNAARDRLWQIDLWRRRGLGELSSVLGEQYLEQDTATRTFLYRGDMYREWLAYGSDAKRIATAFVAGINAYIDLIDAQPELLPIEFGQLGYRPARWQADDVVRIRSHGLWRNVVTEVRRARIYCKLGADAARAWKVLEPSWKTAVPLGLDPCTIPEDVLNTYLLAKAPVRFDDSAGMLATNLADADLSNRQLGSNNWAVAPERTNTGRPILADDPHRGHAVPSLRYIAHLKAPGLNVIGAGEPGLPGISIGHNERIAFGLTIFPIDQEDLYVYVKSKGGYFYNGGAEDLQIITESVAVRDQPEPREISMRFTRHGPVVYETDKHLFAVRAAWLDEGMSPYFGGIEYMRAQNWRAFRESLNRWGAPSENQVYADVDGNIGYKPAGLFPRRNNWDGLLPVPGDGRYEWNGYFDMDVLPVEFNPARGYTSTANAMNLPPDYPIAQYPIGFEWSAPWRHRRLREVLAEQPEHSLEDSAALQRDYVSTLARTLIGHFPASLANSPAASLLRSWDYKMSADSNAAALYAIWLHRHFEPAVAEYLGGDDAALLSPLDYYTLIAATKDPAMVRLLDRSLNSAWQELSTSLGDDSSAWRWGDLHQIRFSHPLLASNPDLAKTMGMPAYPRGGSANTTNNTNFSPTNLDVRSGASFRMVLDVGNWDAATMTNAPGQSGNPLSPYYDNLLEGWASDSAFPLLYSDAAVQKETMQTIKLVPSNTASTTDMEPGNE
ncbi:MAG: penicillin acylase family protein [Pseudomonadales bacterium]